MFAAGSGILLFLLQQTRKVRNAALLVFHPAKREVGNAVSNVLASAPSRLETDDPEKLAMGAPGPGARSDWGRGQPVSGLQLGP